MSLLCRVCSVFLLLVTAWLVARNAYVHGLDFLVLNDLWIPKAVLVLCLGAAIFAALGRYLAPVPIVYRLRRRRA